METVLAWVKGASRHATAFPISRRKRDEIAMAGNAGEVFIGSEQGKSVLTAGCGNQELNWTGIDSLGTANRSQTSSGDIGLSIQLKKWVWIENGQQAVELFRRTESVEEFL